MTSSPRKPDDAVVTTVRRDDPVPTIDLPTVESFDGFYLREFPRLVALAHALTGSRTHAEDIAQESMLACYRRWDEVRQLDLPAAWVRRVCSNLATSHVRRRIVEARAVLRLGSRPVVVAELDVDDGEFWAAVRRLPRRQAQCIALSYVYGASVAEAAAVLGCAEGTVKAHLHRGRSRLAETFGELVGQDAELRRADGMGGAPA